VVPESADLHYRSWVRIAARSSGKRRRECGIRPAGAANPGPDRRPGSGGPASAGTFCGRAEAARLALIDGAPGIMWAQGGQIRVVFDFTIVGGKIVAIETIADPEHLAQLEVVPARRSAWLNGSS